MTAPLEVLIVDDAPVDVDVAARLVADGHTVHTCFPRGATTCLGVSGTCPIDDGVDIAVVSTGTAGGAASIGAICAHRAGIPVASADDDLEDAVDDGWSALRADVASRVAWALREPDGVPADVSVEVSRAGRRLTLALRGPAVSRSKAQEACTRAYDALRDGRRRFADVRVTYTAAGN